MHAVLAKWYLEPRDIEALFLEEFARAIEEKRIPQGYHTERLRNAMIDDLRAFAADGRWPVPGMQSRTEQSFEFALGDGLTIAGKIDRLDVAEDGRAWVIDYKYSRSVKAKLDRREPAAGAAVPDGGASGVSAWSRRGCRTWL